MDFDGKVVLITGAAGGIGKETARLFNENGARLVLVDLNEDALKHMVNELELKDFLLVPADVSQEEDVKNYTNLAVEKYGKIDIFFNNAGIEGRYGELTKITSEEFNQVLDINVKGVFYGLKHVIPVMVENESGSIINTSSVGGVKGSPGLGAYSASKHAVIGLTKTAALENAHKGIRVNAICPAPVNTRMMRDLDSIKSPSNPIKSKKEYEEKIPLKRYAEPNEIAKLVLFLASDKSSFMTGGAYQIDGGLTAK